MNKKKMRMGLLILLILCGAVIFMFSSQNQKESGKLSKEVTKEIAMVVSPTFARLPEAKQQEVVNVVFGKVRKGAHFFLYAVMGVLMMGAVSLWQYSGRKGLGKDLLLSVFFCFLYACSDEVHQLFVPGRGGQLRDVALDTAGALCGILLVSLVIAVLIRDEKGGEHLPAREGGRRGKAYMQSKDF